MEDRQLLSTFLVITTANAGPGSLRQAIQGANANPGPDDIRFNIGGGHQAIRPTTALPEITDTVTIDGISQPPLSSQPPASCNTLAVGNNANLFIELSGSLAGPNTHGLVLRSANSIVRGLVINRFGFFGIAIAGPGATGNRVECNFIGTDPTGTLARPNRDGVFLVGGASRNFLGGNPTTRNLISGNTFGGIGIADPGTSGNVVQSNYCGTNAAGTAALPNGRDGVILFNEAQNNFVGGTTLETRNVLSGNNRWGIGVGTARNVVEGNFIGTTADGSSALGNAGAGVLVTAPDNLIGGMAPGAGNLISANRADGVHVAASNIRVQGNLIGTDVSGTQALGNRLNGVTINGTFQNMVASNLISANTNGVGILGSGATGNVVQGNFIGTDINGIQALGNVSDGVYVSAQARNNTVAGNLISANGLSPAGGAGVHLLDVGTTANEVAGNFVGTDLSGSNRLGNGRGVFLERGAADNMVGGNLISANGNGVEIADLGTSGNVVQGNIIGTDINGMLPLGNTAGGVVIRNGARNNQVGVPPGGLNLIAYNFDYGVALLDNGTSGNVVQSNYIVVNGGTGVHIVSASNNFIGGTGPGEGNTIAWNGGDGVYVHTGTRNAIRGNSISGHDNGVSWGIRLLNGGNNHMPYPTVLAADSVASTITFDTGAFQGAYVDIDFFANTQPHSSGRGEGERYLGTLRRPPGPSYVVSFPAGTFSAGEYITATATDPQGNTSEFGPGMWSTGPSSPSPGAAGQQETLVEAAALARGASASGAGILSGPAVGNLVALSRNDEPPMAPLPVLSDPHRGTARGDGAWALPTWPWRKPSVSGLGDFVSFWQAGKQEELAVAALFAVEEFWAGR